MRMDFVAAELIDAVGGFSCRPMRQPQSVYPEIVPALDATNFIDMFRPFRLLLIAIALLLSLSACSPPIKILNALTPSGNFVATQNLAYGEGARQTLDVYVPKAKQQKPLPVVVFFYGGAWNGGDKQDYLFMAQAMASRGVIAVVPDYRLYPQVRYPDFLRDCAHAVAWTRREIERYGGDPDRIFVMGHSAGAYNAAMLALDPRWLRAEGMEPGMLKGWIGLAGPYEFLPIKLPAVRPVFFHPDYPPGSQPIAYASNASPPAFLGTAIEDSTVDPVRNSQQMAGKLRSEGVAVTEKRYERVDHVTLISTFAWPLRWLAPVLDDVVTFIDTTHGNGAAR